MSIAKICDILDTLLGPNGCPWDQKQTLSSLVSYILEETYELIDAVDHQKPNDIMEEAGDLLFTLTFLIKRSEKDHLFTFDEVVEKVVQKMIRRHPHVFQKDAKKISIPEIEANWKKIKSTKEKKAHTIPDAFPLLMQAKKIFKNYPDIDEEKISEKEWVEKMLLLLKKGAKAGLDMHRILRKAIEDEKKVLKD